MREWMGGPTLGEFLAACIKVGLWWLFWAGVLVAALLVVL